MVRFQRVNPTTGETTGRALVVHDSSGVAYVTDSDRHQGASLITFTDDKSFYVKGTEAEVNAMLGLSSGDEDTTQEPGVHQIEAGQE